MAILFAFVVLPVSYMRFESWKLRQEVLKELGPSLADEQEQKNALLALGKVDLNPSDMSFGSLEQKLGRSILKRPGDFNTTRLGWACGKERCAIWATFLVPLGNEISPTAVPAGLVIKSPTLDDFPHIRVREIRLGESYQKLAALSKSAVSGSRRVFRKILWDKDWTAAWTGLDGKVFELVFANETLQHRFLAERQSTPPSATE